jgi:hypothetical protein
MRITRKARETMDTVSDASHEVAEAGRKVATTSELAAIALVCVSAVSLLALFIGLTALGETRRGR